MIEFTDQQIDAMAAGRELKTKLKLERLLAKENA